MNKYTAYIAAMDKNGGRSHTLDGNSLDSLKRRARAWSMQFAPLRLATICIFSEGEPHCKSATAAQVVEKRLMALCPDAKRKAK